MRRSCAAAKWNGIPYDYQIEIESAWKQSAAANCARTNTRVSRGTLLTSLSIRRRPRHLLPMNSRRLSSKLRATAILIYGAGLYTEGDGDSINSSEISKILGRSARTIHRDNAELLKLWRAYTTASLDQKRDEKLFPSYPLHTAIANGFSLIRCADASAVQSRARRRDDDTWASALAASPDEKVSHGLLRCSGHCNCPHAPRKDLECGPDKAFKIIYGFENPIGESDGHSGTIDAYWNGRGWKAIHAYSEKSSVPKKASPVHPLVWLHDWSQSDDRKLFGDKPARAMLTTSRGISSATYPRTEPPALNSFALSTVQAPAQRGGRFFADVETGRDDLPLESFTGHYRRAPRTGLCRRFHALQGNALPRNARWV